MLLRRQRPGHVEALRTGLPWKANATSGIAILLAALAIAFTPEDVPKPMPRSEPMR